MFKGWLLLACLKKDVNLCFLVITLVVIILFIGSSVLYNINIKKMQNEYDKKIQSLNEIEAKLILEKEKINDILESGKITEKDKEILENNYFDVQNENENLKTKLSSFSVVEKTVCKASGNAKCVS